MCADAITEKNQATGLIPPIQSVAPWCVTQVLPLAGFRLAVTFVDGTHGTVDMSARIHSPKAGVFAALRDETQFSKACIEYGAVTWPGDLDLAPDAMHDEIKLTGIWTLR